MPLHLLHLEKAINATERRIWVACSWLLKRGDFIRIGDEFMCIVRKHRDGSISVERGIGAEHWAADRAIAGDPSGFQGNER